MTFPLNRRLKLSHGMIKNFERGTHAQSWISFLPTALCTSTKFLWSLDNPWHSTTDWISHNTSSVLNHTHDPHESILSGPLSISVPGEINGYYTAWQRFGRLPWAMLFEPVIKMCRGGWTVSDSMAKSIKTAEDTIRNDQYLRWSNRCVMTSWK